MGLTPDHIRVLPEWRAAKVRGDKAFKALQNFNVVYVKTFKKELAAQRAQRISMEALSDTRRARSDENPILTMPSAARAK